MRLEQPHAVVPCHGTLYVCVHHELMFVCLYVRMWVRICIICMCAKMYVSVCVCVNLIQGQATGRKELRCNSSHLRVLVVQEPNELLQRIDVDHS